MNRFAGLWRSVAGSTALLLVIACSSGAEEAGTPPALATEGSGLEADPEPGQEPQPEDDTEPDHTSGSEDPGPEDTAEPEDTGDPEDTAEPGDTAEPEPADPPAAYDGFPIDQAVDDLTVIDEAYVTEVLRVLDQNHANLVLRMRELGIEEFSQGAFIAVLEELTMTAVPAIHGDLFERILVFEADDGFQEELAPARSEVFALQTVREDCISVIITMDAQPFYNAPMDGGWFIGLQPNEVLATEAGSYWRFSGFTPNLGEDRDFCE